MQPLVAGVHGCAAPGGVGFGGVDQGNGRGVGIEAGGPGAGGRGCGARHEFFGGASPGARQIGDHGQRHGDHGAGRPEGVQGAQEHGQAQIALGGVGGIVHRGGVPVGGRGGRRPWIRAAAEVR